MEPHTPTALLLMPLRPWLDRRFAELSTPPGALRDDYTRPVGEPALLAPDSVSWHVFRNPMTTLIGGIAAVVLELAEPRVRAGVYEHSGFLRDPMRRLQRTARATMVTVYGARSAAEALIAGVTHLHQPITGVTSSGQPYSATDPQLLDWVHATASFGFLQAHCAYAGPLSDEAQDRFYAEGGASAKLYGATGAPTSRAELGQLFESMRGSLDSSALLFDFLDLMQRLPLLPRPLVPLQHLFVKAAVQLVPGWARATLRLGDEWLLSPWQSRLVRSLARSLGELPLQASPPVQACRRLGLPDDHLFRSAASRHLGRG